MRCHVCGWVDADAEHERAHLRSQYDYLQYECARLRAELADVYKPRGGNIVTDAILKLGRGLVRPVSLLAITGAIIAAVFVRLLPAEALLAIGGPILGWWFKERAERHDVQDVLREDVP